MIAAASLLLTFAVQAAERLPPLAPEQYDPEQKQAAQEFLAARKAPVFGPFDALPISLNHSEE